MVYTLYYDDFEFKVEQNYDDILEYEFKNAFTVDINPYFLSDEHRKFVDEFADKVYRGDVHMFDYYTTRNYDFINWLKEKYESEAEEARYESEESEYEDPDDWWDDLDDDTKEEIMGEYK